MAQEIIKIQLHGFKELAEQMRNFTNSTAGGLFKAAIQTGATVYAKGARRRAPSRTGALRKGITQKRLATGSYFYAHSRVTSNVWYGYMIEKGFATYKTGRYYPGAKKRWRRTTRPDLKGLPRNSRPVISRTPAHPFMRPTFDADTPAAVDKVGKSLGLGIARKFASFGKR